MLEAIDINQYDLNYLVSAKIAISIYLNECSNYALRLWDKFPDDVPYYENCMTDLQGALFFIDDMLKMKLDK